MQPGLFGYKIQQYLDGLSLAKCWLLHWFCFSDSQPLLYLFSYYSKTATSWRQGETIDNRGKASSLANGPKQISTRSSRQQVIQRTPKLASNIMKWSQQGMSMPDRPRHPQVGKIHLYRQGSPQRLDSHILYSLQIRMLTVLKGKKSLRRRSVTRQKREQMNENRLRKLHGWIRGAQETNWSRQMNHWALWIWN